MGNRIKQEDGQPHPFVTHYIEAIREKDGPKIAIAKLTEFKLETLRFLSEDPVDDTLLEVDSYDGSGKFRVKINRAFKLVDYYCDLYEQEIENNIKFSKTQKRENKLNWTGTYKQYHEVLKILEQLDLIDEKTLINYAVVFSSHFLKDGKEVKAETVRSACRSENVLKKDKEEAVNRFSDAAKRIPEN